MATRHQYRLNLEHFNSPASGAPPRGSLRHPTSDDVDAVAKMLLAAYQGTIDDEGETIDGAIEFVTEAFTEDPLWDACWLVVDDNDVPLSAIVIQRWREMPLVGFVVTDPEYKNEKLGTHLTQLAIQGLKEMGEAVAVAFITEGNTHSEQIFARLGFQRFVEATNPT